MRGTTPFVDAGMSEVLARVSIRLVERAYRRRERTQELSGGAIVAQVYRSLPGPHFGLLKGHLHSLELSLSQGKKAHRWRDEVVARSRYGLDWRRCIDPYYKANRGRDPRVTNRGVTTCDDIFRRENSPLAMDFTDD